MCSTSSGDDTLRATNGADTARLRRPSRRLATCIGKRSLGTCLQSRATRKRCVQWLISHEVKWRIVMKRYA